MALIKYSEANKTTANSYIDTTDAVALIADMPVTSAITLFIASTEQEQLLMRATIRIDAFKYAGSLYDETQRLKFPRYDLYSDDGVALDSDIVPENVEKATLELALFMLENDINATNENLNYTSATVGSVSVDFKDNQVANPLNATLTPYIRNYLKPYFYSSQSLGKN